MKRWAILLVLGVFLHPAAVEAKTKAVKIRGYVTNVISPTEFEIEDYKIKSDKKLTLDLDKGETKEDVAFNPGDIRVGTELEIQGDYDEETGELRARSIKVFLEEYKKVKRTALLAHTPLLERSGEGWVGTFFADGQRIRIDPATQVLFKPNKSERQALKEKEKAEKKAAEEKKKRKKEEEESPEEEEKYTRPLASVEEVGPNFFMTYEGFREPDGSIRALRVEFMRNELEKGEANLWKSLNPEVKEPNKPGKPRELKVPRVGKFKLVQNEEAQVYVRQLGEKLIPAYQKEMPADDPDKVPFRFYLVEGKQANAFALPNGVVVIFSPMFELLQNEAQLGTVVGHEIAHSIQEHSRLQHEYHRKKLMAMRIGAFAAALLGAPVVGDVLNMMVGAIQSGYSRALENQSDRLGLEYLLASGYDPREAPRVWKQMAKKYGVQPTNIFWSSHENAVTRRSYLMAEIRNNYAELDFGQFTTNEAEFQRIAALVKEATTKKKKPKKTT